MSVGRRVIKNALMLYLRMLLVLGVNLYTMRVVLQALGVTDFGLYTVATGLAALFAFMNGAMSQASQRFLGISIGGDNPKKTGKTFGSVISIHIALAAFVILIGASLGSTFAAARLQIPESRHEIFMVVFFISLGLAAATIVQTAFTALIVVKEEMWFFSLSGLLESGLKLAVAAVIAGVSSDRLETFAWLMLLVSLLMLAANAGFCYKRFPEVRVWPRVDEHGRAELLSFIGWNAAGNIAAAGRTQGINILINLFFGIMLNAAYGIMVQVQNAVMSFITSFQNALSPQIYKAYARGDAATFMRLVVHGSKYSFGLLALFVLPLYHNVDQVLVLWLGTPPDGSAYFVRAILLVLWIDSLSFPLMTAASATGRIRQYQLLVGATVLASVPIAYFAFALAEAPWVYAEVMIFTSVAALIVRLYLLRQLIGLSVVYFCKHVLLRSVLLSVVGFAAMKIYSATAAQGGSGVWQIVGSTIVIDLAVVCALLAILVSKNEWVEIYDWLFRRR